MVVIALCLVVFSPPPDLSRHDWRAWEDAVIAHEALGKPGAYSDRPLRGLIAFARICAHHEASATAR
jgi:proline iminopeptidase